MSAEEALDTLTALFPQHSTTLLKQYLNASNQDVARAFRAIERGQESIVTSKSKRRKVDSGLKDWLKRDNKVEQAEVLVLSDSEEEESRNEEDNKLSSLQPTTNNELNPPIKSAFTLLKPPKSFSSNPNPTSTTIQANSIATHVNLPPLRLTTPAMITRETRGLITLVENALPEELASRLFVRMVEASRGEGKGDKTPWKRNKWFLVDREVVSPHTSAFYTESDSGKSNDGWSRDSYDLAATHWFYGDVRESLAFLPEMNEARSLIGSFVNTLLDGRERHEMEWTRGEWRPNAAASNCYKGAQESVGWHSDQLTHLGPFPTIASLTLGCTRPFRLRPFSSTSLPSTNGQPTTMRTLEITLPHNSLLIMHGGTQEVFKHCVPPMNGMDVFKLPKGTLSAEEGEVNDDNAGEGGTKRTKEEIEKLLSTKWRERINLTFRHYRPDFAPLDPSLPPVPLQSSWLPSLSSSPPPYVGTPHCSCGKPCILRPDGKGRIRSSQSQNQKSKLQSSKSIESSSGWNEMIFFWSCNAGAQNDGKGCGFFRVLDFRKEGRGEWFNLGDRREEGGVEREKEQKL